MAAAALLIAAGTPVQAQTAAPAFELLAEYLPCETCAAPAVFHAADGDNNGDGRDDIATIVYGDSGMELHVLLSRKGGRLEPRILPLPGDGLLPAGLEAIDFDGDGYDEVLVTAGFELRLFRLRADGTFSETVIPGEDRPSHAGSVVADFDGDGAVDIATHVATAARPVRPHRKARRAVREWRRWRPRETRHREWRAKRRRRTARPRHGGWRRQRRRAG